MNLRVAKKILKHLDKLDYAKHQIAKAETILGRHQRAAAKKAQK